MKTERDVFDLWFKKNFYDLHEAICCGDLVAKNYKKAMFKAWQASASREGYKLVPVKPTDIEIESIKEKHWDMRGCQLCKSDYIDLYKAMIEAQEPAND